MKKDANIQVGSKDHMGIGWDIMVYPHPASWGLRGLSDCPPTERQIETALFVFGRMDPEY
jgi:hypothetical protein